MFWTVQGVFEAANTVYYQLITFKHNMQYSHSMHDNNQDF